jgi:hypothetical protein
MFVHRTVPAILMIACSVGGAAYWLRAQICSDYYSRRASWREAPGTFTARCVEGLLLGVGIGLSVATLIPFAAALIVRFEAVALR